MPRQPSLQHLNYLKSFGQKLNVLIIKSILSQLSKYCPNDLKVASYIQSCEAFISILLPEHTLQPIKPLKECKERMTRMVSSSISELTHWPHHFLINCSVLSIRCWGRRWGERYSKRCDHNPPPFHRQNNSLILFLKQQRDSFSIIITILAIAMTLFHNYISIPE